MRHSLLICSSILAGCLLIGLLIGRSSIGQPATPPNAQGKYRTMPGLLPAGATSVHGRYQLQTGQPAAADQTHWLVICDTDTGQCWLRSATWQKWTDLGIPASPESTEPKRPQ
jgi:hypothetical protein